MNFLAHLHLSYPQPGLMIGNFLADGITIKDVKSLPTDIIKGVDLHRKIDQFTDEHEVVKEGKRALYDRFSKYAPVVMDVWFDHTLCRAWDWYHPQSLEVFTSNVYQIFDEHRIRLEGKPGIMIDRILQYRWLDQYQTREGIADVFRRLQSKVSAPSRFDDMGVQLEKHLYEIDEVFNAFYPDLIEFVKMEVYRGKSILD